MVRLEFWMVWKAGFGDTGFAMDEQSQSEPPQKYTWPKYVLGGVVLGIVLAIVWMAVLVHRIRGQRDEMAWPTNTVKRNASEQGGPATNPPVLTNAAPAH